MRVASRPSRVRPRTRAAAAGLGLLLAVAAGGSAVAAADREEAMDRADARLVGSVKIQRAAGDVIHFTFDARDVMHDASGTFRFSHHLGDRGAYGAGRIDCMVSGGPVTVLTGVVTDSDLEGLEGRRVGFTVTNDGQRLGYSWAATSDPRDAEDLPLCVSSAPYERVESGGLTVVPWQPKL
ncbi:Repetin [Streptomyces sp. JJ38]|uniref:Repetin n=1 Tax=Streptomyces sp. JJ38 TaxID=2738128 RepID=UPI001C578F18|nr:Repetin [Streptomyces sp. JJ38]MBW1596789.1 Repetin [Streptomyces sp. JJ38]